MIEFHPHIGGINQTREPIYKYNSVAEFVTVIQRLTAGDGIGRITKDDITFHKSEPDPKECSEAFMKFAEFCKWNEIYAVSVEVERNGRPIIIPMGYSSKAFGLWIG